MTVTAAPEDGVAARRSRGPVDPRLLRHARSSRGGIAALALLGAGQAAATVAVAFALTAIVVGLAGGAGVRPGPVALLAGAFAARAALTWAEQVVAQRTAARVTDELRRALLAAILHRGPAWVAGYGSGRLAAVLTGGLDALRPWFGGYLPALVLGVALPPLVIAVIAAADPASAVTAVLTLPLLPVFGVLIGRATQRRAEQRWAAGARLAGHFLDVVRGLGTLKLFGRADRQVAVVAAMTDRHRAATLRVLRVAFLSSTALDLVGTLSVGLIAVGAGLRVAAGDLGLGPALLVILLSPEAYRPVREVAARFHASADAAAVIADVDAILTAPPAPAGPAGSAGATGPPSVVAAGLRVRHPGAAADALALDALTVPGGELVVLRGASGAGKTTALRVLAGLQPLRDGVAHVTGPVHYLPQRPVLPHVRTVADALALDGESRPPDAAVPAALRAVGLDAELPGGPGTPLGEHGQGLSSGQRQRLALARVLRAAGSRPAVLLLDEPTAHLDARAERTVIGLLRAAADRGCAVLVVAHRPAVRAAADRVVEVLRPRPPGEPATAPAPSPAPALPLAPRSGSGPAGTDDDAAVVATRPGAGGDPGPAAGHGRSTVSGRRPSTGGGPVVVAAAGALGAAAWLAGLVLTAAAAWLLVRASTLPPVLSLSTAVVLVRGAAVARPLLRYLERLVSHEVALARLGAWRSRVYAALVARVPGADRTRRGELLTRVVEDVDARVDGLLRGRLPAMSAALALGAAVAAAALVRPAAAAALPAGPGVAAGLVVVAGLAVAAGLAPAVAARHAARSDAATAGARARLREAVVETVDGVEELAVRTPDAALAEPRDRSNALARLEARSARAAGTAAGLAHAGWGAAVVGTALAAGAVVPAAAATAGGSAGGAEAAAAVLLGVVALAEAALTLPDAAVARRRARGATARLAAMGTGPGTELAGTQAASPAIGRGEPSAARSGVVVRGLVAGWDRDRPPALRGLDLDVPPGGRVAVRGASGSGKSTLAAVLAGLLVPWSGTVGPGARAAGGLVGDGVDHVFASTVRENLRLARPEATDADLREVLVRVRLADWLAALPAGLDTWLGEGGTTLSGGERRRLVTARALLSGPALLVLDEPTEGLDEPTAEALMADLLGAAVGRSVVLLTHRQEGLDLVDAVYDLAGGRLRRPAAQPLPPTACAV